jgi:hypothetical protein
MLRVNKGGKVRQASLSCLVKTKAGDVEVDEDGRWGDARWEMGEAQMEFYGGGVDSVWAIALNSDSN